MSELQQSRRPAAEMPVADPTPNLIGVPAGFVSRFIALLIDGALVVFALSLGSVVWSALMTVGPAHWLLVFVRAQWPGIEPLIVLLLALLPTILGVLMACAYFVFFFAITGQTIGKRLMGLRIVAIEGEERTVGRAALRLAGYLLSALPLYAGFLAMLLNERRQTWHDRLAGTMVVYAWEARPNERFLRRRAGRLNQQ